MKRSKLSHALTASLVGAALVSGSNAASAAVITDVNAAWPTAPDTQTLNANGVTHANRGISGTRVNRQSFTVTSDVTVGSIFLSASNYGGTAAFTIAFYSIANVNTTTASAWTGATQIGNTITVDALGTAAAGDRTLRIDLSESEQVTLPAATGGAGYIMAIRLADTTSSAAFNWVHSNTGSDIYSGGRFRRDDGDMTNTRDMGVALVAVPEPASIALASLGGLAVLGRRRVG